MIKSFLPKRINQIALVVNNLEKVIEHYMKTMGFGPWDCYTYGIEKMKSMTYRGRPSEARFKIAMTDIDGLNFELIEPISKGDNIFDEFIQNNRRGIHHIGINVENTNKIIEVAKKNGIAMIQDGYGFGKDGDGHFAYLDTEELLGVIIELRELPKRRITPDKIISM